jgi:hypothetical protein
MPLIPFCSNVVRLGSACFSSGLGLVHMPFSTWAEKASEKGLFVFTEYLILFTQTLRQQFKGEPLGVWQIS